jgi:hypothetical protein
MRPHLLALALFVAQLARAGGEGHPLGARLAGMGYAGSALADLWALRLNPAGLAALDTAQVGAVYQRHFFADELAQQGLAVAIPLGNGTLGIAADRFGYSLYNETRTSLAYAMRFGDGLRAAVQMDHVGMRLGENYGSAGTLVAELGVQARLTNALWIGAHLYNPNRSMLGGPYDERVPTLLRAGLAYTFSSKLVMTADVEKDIDRKERFRFGIEYNPNKALYLRTGLATGPMQGTFGAGFRLKHLDIDLAVALRSQLGPTPVIGLNYRFG